MTFNKNYLNVLNAMPPHTPHCTHNLMLRMTQLFVFSSGSVRDILQSENATPVYRGPRQSISAGVDVILFLHEQKLPDFFVTNQTQEVFVFTRVCSQTHTIQTCRKGGQKLRYPD